MNNICIVHTEEVNTIIKIAQTLHSDPVKAHEVLMFAAAAFAASVLATHPAAEKPALVLELGEQYKEYIATSEKHLALNNISVYKVVDGTDTLQ